MVFAVIVCMVVRTLFPLVLELALGCPACEPAPLNVHGFGGFLLHCCKHESFFSDVVGDDNGAWLAVFISSRVILSGMACLQL